MEETLSIIASILVIGSIIKWKSIKKLFNPPKKEPFKILFIDDEFEDFPLINIIDSNSEFTVRSMHDANSLTDEAIVWANVVFVDIHDVGKKMNLDEEGKALAVAIKKKYPTKKVVLYSFDATGNIMDDELDLLDWRIKKSIRSTDVIGKLSDWYDVN